MSPAARFRSIIPARALARIERSWFQAPTLISTIGPALSKEEYEASKRDLIANDPHCLGNTSPVSAKNLDPAEASTPRTFQHYTRHVQGA